MQWTRTHCCTSHCMAQVLVHASSHPHSHPCLRHDRLFSPFSSPCSLCVFLLSLLLLPEPWLVPLPLPCANHWGNIPLALRQMRSLALWPITRLSQEKSRVRGRWTLMKKIDWRPKHDYGAKSQNSGITEWRQLYEWLERLEGFWVSTQWTIPRYQSTSVTPTFSRSWWNAKPFSGNAELQR